MAKGQLWRQEGVLRCQWRLPGPSLLPRVLVFPQVLVVESSLFVVELPQQGLGPGSGGAEDDRREGLGRGGRGGRSWPAPPHACSVPERGPGQALPLGIGRGSLLHPQPQTSILSSDSASSLPQGCAGPAWDSGRKWRHISSRSHDLKWLLTCQCGSRPSQAVEGLVSLL